VRGHMAVSLFALVFGALETGGAVQELVYRGVLNSETDPMIVGALGTVTGAVLLWTGGALLIRSRLMSVRVPATVYLSVPTFLISGFTNVVRALTIITQDGGLRWWVSCTR
jgi:hypothetical protein